MTWANPGLLALLLLLPLALLLGVAAWRARRTALSRFAHGEVLRALLPPGVNRARGWQVALTTLAAGLLAVGAAGPRLGFDWEQRRMEGVAIVLVLDVSRSMDAQDVSPSRLERARREIVDFVGLLRGDAVGLVVFAAGAYVRIPLTVDYDTLLWAVDDTTTGTIRAQGTALAGALDAATQMLSRAEGSGKAVVIVSDGEAHDDDAEVDQAVARAGEAGIRLYGLGVGEPSGAPIPLEDGGFKKDARGDVVLSRLDEDRLRRLAAATGGAYVRAVASDADVRALYEDEIRGKLEAAVRGVRRDKIWRERFQWPLAGALVAMVVGAALGIGRRGAAVLMLAALLPARAWAGARDDGLSAFRAEKWAEAAERLGQARVEEPDDVEVGGALAEALYRAGRMREAEQVWRSLAAEDPDNRALWLYDAGHAAYGGGRLAEAAEHFEEAAQADPKLEAAKKNAEAVRREIQARLQEQPPQQDQGEQGEQGEGQPQEGQPQQGEGQPQDGPPQDGQPQDGQAGQEGQPRPPQEGTRPAEQEGAEPGAAAAAGEEGMREGEETPEEGVTAVESGEAGRMSKEAAGRLVDGVPDGKPRVVVGGRSTEKDW